MQIEYFGNGTIARLRTAFTKHQAQKIFIVTGKLSFVTSGAARALESVCAETETIIFDAFTPNPKLNDAVKGITLVKRFQPDFIIAIGGGSVIDMGKLIMLLATQHTDNYISVIKQSLITSKGLPFAAVPTTAGTGSEATRFAVVYIDGIKYSLNHRFVLPDYSIVDPTLSSTMPPYQAAVSGMDALCQAVESYWSVNATKQSREYSAEAIKTIYKYIKGAVSGESDKATQEMARGANLAGKAINITQTTAPHAISYPLTSHYSIPHGHAVALVLGKFFLINELSLETITDSRTRRSLEQTFSSLYALFGCLDANCCSKMWYDLMTEIGLETDFVKLGVLSEIDHEFISNSVNQERLSNHPFLVNFDVIKSLF